MTKLLQRLHDELVRRDYATTTRESYLRIVKAFHRRSGARLDRVGPDDLRRYQVYLLEERKLAVGTVVAEIAATAPGDWSAARVQTTNTAMSDWVGVANLLDFRPINLDRRGSADSR